MIACVLIPFFAAMVEQRLNALADGPMIIHAHEKVYAVDNAAAQLGIQLGMPLRKARTLSPEGQFVTATPAEYRRTFTRLLDILRTFTPLIEPSHHALPPTNKRRSKAYDDAPFASDDSLSAVCYLDLEKLKESECSNLAQEIAYTTKVQLGLDPALGLARGKFPARVAAASVLPGHECLIPAGTEGSFLAPLPVTILPLDNEMARRLRLLGIQTLEQLAHLPADSVSMQFGKTGHLLHQWAQGEDTRRVIPQKPPHTEQAICELDEAIVDRAVLDNVLRSLVNDLAQRLQERAAMCRRVEVVLKLGNGKLHESRITLRQPVSNAGHLSDIVNQLVGQVLLLGGVKRVEISLSELVPVVGQQLDLFVQQTGQDKRLRAALQDIVARYGSECFFWISLSDDNSRLPERGFRLRPVDHS